MNHVHATIVTIFHLLFWLSFFFSYVVGSSSSTTGRDNKYKSPLEELIKLIKANIIHQGDKARAVTIVSELQGTMDAASGKMGERNVKEVIEKLVDFPYPKMQPPSEYVAWEAETHSLFTGELL